MATTDLIVLGAGPAGLAAAYHATRRGQRVLVLERAEQVGGLAASFEVAGVRVDYGSHRLSPNTPLHILADLRALLGSDLQTRYRNGRILLEDTWVTYPFKPRELVRTLPPAPLARAARDTLAGWRRKPAADGAESYAQLMRAGFGPTLYELVYEPFARKLFGLTGDQLDVDQARRKAGAPSAWSAILQSVRTSLAGESLSYLYPRRGFGQLCEALAQAATAAGAQIRLGVEAEKINALHTTGISVTPSGASGYGAGSGALRAGHLFSTLPLPLLARMTTPSAPYEVIEAASRLRFRAILLVYAVHHGGRWTPHDVHYIPNADIPVTRISEPGNHRLSPEDPEDRSVVCFEIPCEIGDEIWNADECDLADLVADTVARCGLPSLHLEWVQVKRMRHAYPLHHRGYRDQLTGLEAWADALPHVTTFGRHGLFTTDNVHHALTMGYEAAEKLGPGRFDREGWRSVRPSFHSHTVEV